MNLPDELLLLILQPALTVPDCSFADTGHPSPFSKYRYSSASYLLVAKSWYRVALPFLYSDVVLRSTAQALALARTLHDTPHLGLYTRRMRLEGAFGFAIQTIIEASPNITDLFVPASISVADDARGLCRVLPKMNPKRVIIWRDMTRFPSPHASVLRDALTQAIERWESLTIFEFPDICATDGTLLVQFASSLKMARKLETISIPFTAIFLQAPAHLLEMAPNSSLKRISMRGPPSGARMQLIAVGPVIQHPVLSKLVELPEKADPITPLTLAPTAVPRLQYSTSNIPEEIWSRILCLALSLDEERPSPSDRVPFLGLVTTCKLFARIAQPYLHSTSVLRSSFDLVDFLSRLIRTPSIRPALRALFFELPFGATVSLDALFALPSGSRLNLISVIGIAPVPLSTHILTDLARYCGDSLRRMEGITLLRSHGKESPTLWGSFTNLRVLDLESRVFWQATPELIPVGALPLLESVRFGLGNHPGTESLVRVFVGIDLPALRHAMFAPVDAVNPSMNINDKLFVAIKRFSVKHGPSKLKRLDIPTSVLQKDVQVGDKWLKILDLCDALQEFVAWGCRSTPPAISFRPMQGRRHTALKRIVFMDDSDAAYPGGWADFFMDLDLEALPSLKEVKVPWIRWPNNEEAIARSFWVDAAERLLLGGVQLVDGDGLGWRPRL
ncbi:F-box domain-containing protein [Mycena kentingensis (nom. inval.)]|nr:F-box domain-containing protein [Mycena kentingensis (nom. inval.)]